MLSRSAKMQYGYAFQYGKSCLKLPVAVSPPASARSVEPLAKHSFTSTSSDYFQAPLHYEWVTVNNSNGTASSDATRIRTTISSQNLIIFLHGLLGNGKNLKTFAKQFCERHAAKHDQTTLGVLIDLPGHGKSRNRKTDTTFATLQDCVHALHETLQALVNAAKQEKHSTSDEQQELTLVGHSFGGRVALQYSDSFEQLHHVDEDALLVRRLVLLDTVPGQPNQTVADVLRIAGEITMQQKQKVQEQTKRKHIHTTLSKAKHHHHHHHGHHHHLSKSALTKLLVHEYKMDLARAQWLSTLWISNEQEFAIDLPMALGFLQEFDGPHIGDVFCQQLHHILHEHPTLKRVDLVRGLKNAGWREETVQKHVQEIEAWSSSSSSLLSDSSSVTTAKKARLYLHDLPYAAHWVHVDDLPGLLNVLLDEQKC